MILMNIAIILAVLGIMITIIGKCTNKKKVTLLGIYIISFVTIGIILFFVYAIESEDEEVKSKMGETNIQNELFTDSNEKYYNEIKNNSLTNEGTTLIAVSGIIENITEKQIQVGLNDIYLTHDILIKETTFIKDYLTNNKVDIEDLKQGDCIYIEGSKIDTNDNIEKVEANTILVCKKETVKSEVDKYLINTYRIDGMGIEYANIDNDGNGYIIVTGRYENFIYPIKLNVTRETETYLGMGYHLQSNYGYIFHEMSDITLDTKITDIDNITGYVKTIEYIAD